MASMKKANASRAKGRPITAPHRPISPGQKRPSAKESTVPETAPTATRIPSALAHRRHSAIHTASPVRFARYSANRSSTGRPTASAAKTMWNPSDTAICARAAWSDVSATMINITGRPQALMLSGDERTRTADPLLAKQVLYQLSYVPDVTLDHTDSPEQMPQRTMSVPGRSHGPRARENAMTDYLLLYSGGSMPETEEEQKNVMEAWNVWMGKL